MNKKVSGIAISLLLAAMFVAPIMAAPETKYDVTVMQEGVTSGFTYHVSQHGNRVVLQLRDGVGTSEVTLNLPGGPVNGEGVGHSAGKDSILSTTS
jgi:hypothetical protein